MTQGVDIRESGGAALLVRAFLQDSSGVIVTTGDTQLRVYELNPADGTLSSFDWLAGTFTTGLPGLAFSSLMHQAVNSVDTGIWTKLVSTSDYAAFTDGRIYFAHVTNTNASPTIQVREFQAGITSGSFDRFDSAIQTDWVDGGRLDLLVDAIKAKTDDLTFTVANQVDSNDLSGGGDATAANQTSILALLAAGATIQSPVPSATTIEVINADRYDGTAAPLLTWTVTKDYSAATTVKLVIYKKGYPDTIYKTATGVVASATSITVDLDVDFGDSITFSGVPLKSELGFALVADWSGEEETIARGDCYVYDRGVPA